MLASKSSTFTNLHQRAKALQKMHLLKASYDSKDLTTQQIKQMKKI
jgi:hypothetical protein